MRNDLVPRIKSATIGGVAVATFGLWLAAAQEAKVAPPPAQPGAAKAAKKEIVSGVIVKAEKVPAPDAKGPKRSPSRIMRLTINPNAVWSDWVRDQAQVRDDGSPKKDAARGAKSIATLGQPADKDNVVVVEVTDATKVETRFRSPSDETTKGEERPEKVKSDEGTTSKESAGGNPVRFRPADLLPGLFVEAEFRASEKSKDDPASTITVIRPIDVPETKASSDEASPR